VITSLLFVLRPTRIFILNRFGILVSLEKLDVKLKFETLLSYPVVAFFSFFSVLFVYTCISMTIAALFENVLIIIYITIVVLIVPLLVKQILRLIVRVSSNE